MLVISRKHSERYRITTADGTVIWITTLEVDRGKARHGIEAPADCKIVREELIGRTREQEAA